jgi:hypothetical protein
VVCSLSRLGRIQLLNATGLIMSELADWPWNMIGALISAASLLATVIIGGFVIRDVRRLDRPRRAARRPGIAHFIIPSSLHHGCDFAKANEYEHRVKSITLPSHRTRIVDLFIESSISLTTSQVSFGFEGEYFGKPVCTEIFNRFIVSGPRRCVIPGKPDNNDYCDKHKFYHAVENWDWSIGDGKTYGFKIVTDEPGIYILDINFSGDVSAGKIDDLQVVVQDEPTNLMYCVQEEHISKDCAAGLKPKWPEGT